MLVKDKTGDNSARGASSVMLSIIAGLVIILDQITKYIVSSKISLYEQINVIPNVLNITKSYNPGGAFGIMSQVDIGIRTFLFVGGSCLIVGMIICFHRSIPHSQKPVTFGLSFIVGGAIGNTMDRLRFGEVIDFIDFFIFSYHWPTFNIADSAITIGIFILILYLTLDKIKIKKTQCL